MPRMRKIYKKYERHILLGLVILLLATFSITGALKCRDRGQHEPLGLGGTFKVSPSRTAEIDDEEFDRLYGRFRRVERMVQTPSREYRQFSLGLETPLEGARSAWTHILTHAAAAEAGYRAGQRQIRSAIEDVVGFRLMVRSQGRATFSNEAYDQMLDDYRLRRDEFEEVAKEMVVKDQFLTPLVEASRYQVTYDQAFETWKPERERVDLEYVALPAAAFAERVRLDEKTRLEISRQETRLRKLAAAAAQVKRVLAAVEAARAASGSPGPDGQPGTDDDVPGSYPQTLADLDKGARPFKVVPDVWGEALRYRVEDGRPDLASAGPDRTFDTADDVTRETQRQLDTHGSAYEIAQRLQEHRARTGAWAGTLKSALEDPATRPGAPGKDGWDRDFVYEPGGGEEAAVLISFGPDGVAGGGDDLRFPLDAQRVRILPGPALQPFLLADARDAWGRPFEVALERGQPPAWGVASAGADGEFATDDDVKGGNELDLKSFFATVRSDFTLDPRRSFETLFVHLPLVSDEVLRCLWEKYPEYRPTDEAQLFDYWQSYRGAEYFYHAEDPVDPDTGHGAELMKRIAPDAHLTLVPARSIFPDPLRKPGQDGDEPGSGDEEKAAPKDGDDEKEPADGEEADPPKDGSQDAPKEDSEPDARSIYRDKGWREIVIREQFMESLLNGLLQRCRRSPDEIAQARKALDAWPAAHAAWKTAVEVWERENAEKPEAQRAPKPEEPVKPEVGEELTFERLRKEELAACLVGEGGDLAVQYWRTPELLTREQWEENPNFASDLHYTLDRLKEDGDYVGIPAQLHRRLTKVLVRRLEFQPRRQQEYEEVEDAVFDRYVESEQMERAVKELGRLKDAIRKAEQKALAAEAGDETPEAEGGRRADPAVQAEAIRAWSEGLGTPYFVETTGLFVGNTPPPDLETKEGAPEAEVKEAKRRNFVWRTGYATVRPQPGATDGVEAKPGTFGRTLPKDPGSGCAYLIRVKERVYPTRAEFSPRRYVEVLSKEVFGDREQRRVRNPLSKLKGRFFKVLHQFVDDLEWLQARFELQTTKSFQQVEGDEKQP